MVSGMWTLNEGLDHVAQYEEEDEDQYEMEDPKKRIEYHMNYSHEAKSLSGDCVVIAIGNAANSFLETHIEIPDEHLAEFLAIQTSNPPFSNDAKVNKKRSCLLYKSGNVVLCMVKYNVEPNAAHCWMNTLMSNIDVRNVVVLCSSPKSSFVGDEEVRSSASDVLRCLKSTSSSSSKIFDRIKTASLEEGNLLKGLSAAVLSYCEALEVACVLYITYTESHFVDVFTLKSYQPILMEGFMDSLQKVSQPILFKRLRDFEGCGVADNNVYI